MVNYKFCKLHLLRNLNPVVAWIDRSIIKKLGHPFIQIIIFFIEVENSRSKKVYFSEHTKTLGEGGSFPYLAAYFWRKN